MTSHDVCFKLRKILGTKKVGHSGTLDPMATGGNGSSCRPEYKVVKLYNRL